VLAKVENTMSDRHIVEKNFNSLLEDYRKETRLSIILVSKCAIVWNSSNSS